MSAILFTYVVESADVRVVQAGNRSGFSFESFSSLGTFGQVRGEYFDRYVAVESGVFRLVNLTHASGSDEREDFVRA
jgi:hypothetical protein